jgi:hypothetical protein
LFPPGKYIRDLLAEAKIWDNTPKYKSHNEITEMVAMQCS